MIIRAQKRNLISAKKICTLNNTKSFLNNFSTISFTNFFKINFRCSSNKFYDPINGGCGMFNKYYCIWII